MTPKQLAEAKRLYLRYKTDTLAYRRIADELRIDVGELNRRMWYATKGKPWPVKPLGV